MSRIGKQPVPIADKVDVKIDGNQIHVRGPKGELERTLSDVVEVTVEDKEILVKRPDDSSQAKAHQGLVRSLVANMVEGVTRGYERVLEINGVGYRAEQRGTFVRLDLGFSHPILFELPESVDVAIKGTTLTLSGIDKESVTQTAAKIRSLRPPEPYKGKGIKYNDEVIRRKAGKAGKA